MHHQRHKLSRGVEMIVLSLASGFDFAGSEYRDLFAASDATAFQHPLWLSTLHKHLVTVGRADQLTIAGYDEKSGELVLVLPLIRRNKFGTTIIEYADFGVTDYCAPVIRRGYRHQIARSTRLASDLRWLVGRCDMFRVKAARPEHVATINALTGLSPQTTGTCSHELEINAPFEQWRREKYSKSHLRQVDGSHRRIGRLGDVGFERITNHKRASDAIAELRAFRAGRFDGDPISEENVYRFYAEVAEKGAASGFAQVHKITLDGTTVGIDFGIAYAGRFHGILIGCDYDTYRRCSPGFLMYDMVLADWASSGGNVLDFNVGDSSYKEKFGTTALPVTSYCAAMTVTGRVANRALSLRTRFRQGSGLPKDTKPHQKVEYRANG